jgi:hypothetical protein
VALENERLYGERRVFQANALKRPRSPVPDFVLAASVVPKHRQQDDDGDRNTEQPKKSASTETHDMSSSELDLAAVLAASFATLCGRRTAFSIPR